MRTCVILAFTLMIMMILWVGWNDSHHATLSHQAGMTAPGTRRHIFDRKLNLENCDASTISLQMGTNKVASQQGMTTYGLPRQVFDNKYCANPAELYYDNGSEVEFDGYNQYSD